MIVEAIRLVRVRFRSETVQRLGYAGRLREIRAGARRAGTDVGQAGAPGNYLQPIPVIALDAVVVD